MKIEKWGFIFLIAFIFTQCKQDTKHGFQITGKTNKGFNDYIILRYSNQVDTVLVKNGSFQFKGQVETPTEAYFKLKNASNIQTFMLENSTIYISLQLKKRDFNEKTVTIIKMDSISGSKSQVLEQGLLSSFEKNFNKEPNENLKSEKLYTILYSFLSENPTSSISGKYLARMNEVYDYLDGQQLEKLYQLLDTSYQTNRALTSIRSTINQEKFLKTGNIPPSFSLFNQNEQAIESSSFKGKYVLLEFWASWCTPCRYQNPELIDIYKTYQSKDFEIVGISADKNKDQWKAAIEKDGISLWTQLIDSNSLVADQYYAYIIPFNVLLDKEGKIIAKGLKPFKLESILKSIIKE
ncbi:MAG: AhpC/TSA family protein [Flavobacteriaceae bacterium]